MARNAATFPEGLVDSELFGTAKGYPNAGMPERPGLIAEADGKASLSRFQFLLFTFVVAGLYFLLCVEAGTLIEVPASVLGILGISASGYVLSKGVTASKETLIARGARPARRSPGNAEPDAVISITQPDPAVATQAELKL